MLKVKYLILMVLFSGLLQAEPCKIHKGQPLPWEGSGACTGNNHIEIPLETTNLSMHFHSAEPTGDFGFGESAWRLSADHRLLVVEATTTQPIVTKHIVLDRGDGTQRVLDKETAGVWKGNPILTRATVEFVGAIWREISPDGSQTDYSQVAGKQWWVSTSMKDSKGNVTTIERNAQGYILKIKNPYGKEIVIDYENNGNRATNLKDYQAGTYFFGYQMGEDSESNPIDLNVLSVISRPDGSGWKITNNGDEQNYYVPKTQVLSYNEPDGTSHSLAFYNDDQNTIDNGSLIRTSEFIMPDHDGHGYTYTNLSVSYSSRYNSLEEVFNNHGQLILSTDKGISTGFIRRSDGLPSIVTTDEGETVLYGYDEITKNLKSVKTCNGVVDTNGNCSNPTLKTFTYASLAGRPMSFANNNPASITTATGAISQSVVFTYDDQNRVLRIIPSLNNRIITSEVQVFERDSRGNITHEYKGGIDTFSFTYNTFSQMTSKTEIVTGKTTYYNYVAGNLVSVTDPLGIKTSYEHNPLGLVTKVINPDGTVEVTDYDALGRESFNQITGPTGASYTKTTRRQTGPIVASFNYKKRKTIEASFNIIPLVSLILPWKEAKAEDTANSRPGFSSTFVDEAYLPVGGTGATDVRKQTNTNGVSFQSNGLMNSSNNISFGGASAVCQKAGDETYANCIALGGPGQISNCSSKREEAAKKCTEDTACYSENDSHGPGKPVIYLYPEKTQNVKVFLDFLGKLTVTYPEYDTKKGWNVEARPDGTLTSLDDKKEYSYLFWEGISDKPTAIDYSKGFIVAGKDAREFLQETLAKIGLTPKEYNEFIVFWYPRMKDNAFNYVHFAGKPYTDIAKLDITPKPDSILRVFMVFKPLKTATEMKVTPQEFPKFERKGFAVVEWGGAEENNPKNLRHDNKVAAGSATYRME